MNKLINDKQLKVNEKRKQKAASSSGITSPAGMSSASQFSLDKSVLDPSRLFTMNTTDIERELNKIHSGILSSNFLLGSLPGVAVAAGAADTTEAQELPASQVIVLNSMSNTSPYEWREAAFTEETKYIKEPLAYRNPFKLMIRPRNQVLQLNEIEDEAYLTNDEKKKKSTKLASYAIVYKQQVGNMLRKYGQWFRETRQNNASLDQKMQEWIRKHAEDKKNASQKEADLKRRFELKDSRRANGAFEAEEDSMPSSRGMFLEQLDMSEGENQQSAGGQPGNNQQATKSRKQSQEFAMGASQNTPRLSLPLATLNSNPASPGNLQFSAFCALFDDTFSAKSALEKHLSTGSAVGDDAGVSQAVGVFMKDLQQKYKPLLGDSRNLALQKGIEMLGVQPST